MTISQIIPGALDTADLSETVASTALGRAEHPANKDAANGYAGLDASSKLALAQIPTGVELSANKGVASGYAPLDSGVLVSPKYMSPHLTSVRVSRRIVANALDASLSTMGLATPTADTNSAAVALDDADGCYYQVFTLSGSANTNCGIYVASATKRRLAPDVVIAYRSSLADTRLMLGFASADPIALTSFTSIKCALGWFDYSVHAAPDNYFRFVTSSGSAQTETTTAMSAATLANAWNCVRIRFVTGTSSFELMQWNTATSDWTSLAIHSTNLPATTDALGLYIRARSLTTTQRYVALEQATLISD